MKIGICGPVYLPMLKKYLDPGKVIPVKGMGGSPVNHQIVALLEKGHEVVVYSLTPEIGENERLFFQGDRIKIYMGPYRKKGTQRCKDLFMKERRFLKTSMLDSKPDIVHAHWQYEWGWAALDSGIPTLLTCHDAPFQVLKVQRDWYRVARLLMAGICLHKAKHLTAVSPYTAKGLRFFTRQDVSVIPNFEPDSVFSLMKNHRTIGDKINITMINNGFHHRKNVAVGVKAFETFSKKIPGAELHLYGSGNGMHEDADLWCEENNVSGNIFFHGEIPFDQLMNSLSKADIFLHTSLEESCPMVLIEAMAMGIPVVAGEKAGGIPWMLENGGGELVDINDSLSVSEALEKLAEPDVYKKLSEEARDIAVARFSKEVVVGKYLEAYKQVLNS